MVIERSALQTVLLRLGAFPCGGRHRSRPGRKTTLAQAVAGRHAGSVYLDLERPSDVAKPQAPELFLDAFAGRLVVLDEIQRIPGLFQVLRGVIDRRRAAGKGVGQFLVLGSASIELLKQSAESLAGRISYVELSPLLANEVPESLDRLWLRGGFPPSFLAPDDETSLVWREAFIRTYLERDIPQLGPRIPAERLRRFWTMLAHEQGGLLNAARLAASLGVSGATIAHYVDLMVDLLLVRRLRPVVRNAGKRLVKTPKLYIRDGGLVHALLGLSTPDAVLGHPVAGGSWEGFVIENLVAAAGDRTGAAFYRTGAGAEIDLVLEPPGGGVIAVEVKRAAAPWVPKFSTSERMTSAPGGGSSFIPGSNAFRSQRTLKRWASWPRCRSSARRVPALRSNIRIIRRNSIWRHRVRNRLGSVACSQSFPSSSNRANSSGASRFISRRDSTFMRRVREAVRARMSAA